MARFVPSAALPAGRVSCWSERASFASRVTVGGAPAHVAAAQPGRVDFDVPADLVGGRQAVALDGELVGELTVATLLATGFDQVDSPALAPDGAIYTVCSGTRVDTPGVSVFRVESDGVREAVARGIRGATSVTVGPDAHAYVSSRFDGVVYRLDADGSQAVVASDLGAPCGLAFDADARLCIGDRTGSVFRVERGSLCASHVCRRAWPRFIWRPAQTAVWRLRRRRCRPPTRSIVSPLMER